MSSGALHRSRLLPRAGSYLPTPPRSQLRRPLIRLPRLPKGAHCPHDLRAHKPGRLPRSESPESRGARAAAGEQGTALPATAASRAHAATPRARTTWLSCPTTMLS